MLECYYKILSIHLHNKRWKKHYAQIVFHLDCVSKGYKPSFLWDIGPSLDVNTLNNLIYDLKSASLLSSFVYSVLIEEEKFIVNLVTLCQYFENLDFVKVIDCSSCFDNPVMIDRNSHEKVISMLCLIKDKLLCALESHKKGNACQDTLRSVQFETNVIQCPPTVFGVMLGYPAVYWAIDILKGNCLSNIPLSIYKIKINNPSTFPFKNDYELYSFSTPTCLNLDNFVDNWLVRLSERTGVNFQLCKNIVINSCVQL